MRFLEYGPPAPYFTSAHNYLDNDLIVLPCIGKKPAIKNWPNFGLSGAKKLSEDPKFSSHNLCLVGGKRITIVDVDDTSLNDYAIDRFGDTPIKVQTHSGKLHLWYLSKGERARQRLEGRKIDIIGKGKYAVVPPSVGEKGRYRFIEGGLNTLNDLPFLKSGSLENLEPKIDVMVEGIRNTSLFKYCISRALKAETEEDLFSRTKLFNDSECKPPLPLYEVEGIVRSVWNYKKSETLYLPGQQATMTNLDEINSFSEVPDAYYLYQFLKAQHKGIRNTFVISQEEVSKNFRWCRPRLNKAIKILLKFGHLNRVGYQGRCHLYRLPE